MPRNGLPEQHMRRSAGPCAEGWPVLACRLNAQATRQYHAGSTTDDMSHTIPAAAGTPAAHDWRLALPEEKRRPLRIWLWSIAAMTLAVLIVGGITRLTQSGLSITDWQPLMGVIPPLSEAQWIEKFDLYRQYPEYQQLRRGMSLDEFKFIFFWEYLHRLVARAIGIVFLVPFAFFAVRGYLNRPLALRTLGLFALGGMQGVLGWLMVQSGLVDQPTVSHYRLAAHLGLAFVIFCACVWLARDLRASPTPVRASAPTIRLMRRGLAVIGVLLALQVVWGAFVAGLKAGLIYNTFPLMDGRLIPVYLLGLEPAIRNFFENPVAVQWLHRVLGTVLGVVVIGFGASVARAGADAASRRLNAALVGLMLLQYLLGVLTLLYFVPVALGVIHQAMAMILFGVWTWWLHHVQRLEPAEAGVVTAGR
jgi:heme a synthase